MALAYGTASPMVGVASGNITLTAPASIADNDILIAAFIGDDTVVISLTGWTQIIKHDHTGVGLSAQALYKRASGESGNYTFTHTGGGTTGGRMYRITGAITSGSPISGTAVSGEGNSTAYSTGSMTPADANNMVQMLMLCDGETNSFSAEAGGGLTWTERFDDGDAATSFKRIALATAPQPTAAALTGTATISGSTPWLAIFFSLNEAAAGGDPEGRLIGGKLVGGGLLRSGVLV